jgi:HAD superfamily hydrolase (TIGR01509 family)
MINRTVILDIGGVLEITPPTGWGARWEQHLGLPAGEIDRRCAEVWEAGSIGTITEARVREEVAARLSLDAPQVEAFMADLWHQYLGTPNEAMIAYVRSLRGRCHLGILSNSFVGAREREHDLVALVDEAVYSHEIGINKPDPRTFAITCERLRSRPEDCLFVDDHPPNIAAAQAFGMQAILFRDNASAIAAVEGFLTRAVNPDARGDSTGIGKA